MVQAMPLSTFSIVGHDSKKQDLGVAVESRFPCVGSIVPHALAKVGAAATQSYANVTYGPRGLELLAAGKSPEEVIQQLTASDAEADKRQVAVVDAKGRAAAFTGKECFPWAGHRVGKGYSAQGNILQSESVVLEMCEGFESAEGDLADRLLLALEAGQRAGGDRRGQQSAALLVVREKGGYGGFTDRYVDIRVDDHQRPIEELRRIFRIYDLILLDRGDPTEFVPIDTTVGRRLQQMLTVLGYYEGEVTGRYDVATSKALESYAGVENLENRLRKEPVVSRRVLEFMENQARARSHDSGAQSPGGRDCHELGVPGDEE